uniref:Uncharacterized protein n=1 Tax=Romanomermis culicivorax TaxID=13658 RepID=A0A915K9C0_ROMCU
MNNRKNYREDREGQQEKLFYLLPSEKIFGQKLIKNCKIICSLCCAWMAREESGERLKGDAEP